MIQSGQKFAIPATSGITPKKNQKFPVITPVVISAKPTTIRTGLQIFLILLKSIFITFILKYFAIISILSKINPIMLKSHYLIYRKMQNERVYLQ